MIKFLLKKIVVWFLSKRLLKNHTHANFFIADLGYYKISALMNRYYFSKDIHYLLINIYLLNIFKFLIIDNVYLPIRIKLMNLFLH